MITNQDGDIEYVNEKFCEVTGYSKEEVLGKNPRILKSGYHDKVFTKNFGTISCLVKIGKVRCKTKEKWGVILGVCTNLSANKQRR